MGGAAFTLHLDAKYPGHGFKAAACQSLTTTDERVCIDLVHTACGCAERMGRLFQVILLDCCSVYVRMCLTMGGKSCSLSWKTSNVSLFNPTFWNIVAQNGMYIRVQAKSHDNFRAFMCVCVCVSDAHMNRVPQQEYNPPTGWA